MSKTILLTGANGYLGNIILATLMSRTEDRFILLLRPKHRLKTILDQLRQHMEQDPLLDVSHLDPSRITLFPLPPIAELENSLEDFKRLEIKEIIHCAGLVDYFNTEKLQEVNVDFTQKLLNLGQQLQIERFIHISTAFAGGYNDIRFPETLFPEPPEDPTEYTRSKRRAEAVVAHSGSPYLILRPSIVIGDSRSGFYEGKPYGIYQVIRAAESMLLDQYHEELHVLAPQHPLPLLHQDAFQEGFFSAYRHAPADTIINLVSAEEHLPTARDLWEFFVNKVLHPKEAVFYENLEEVDFSKLKLSEKTLMEFCAINFQIAAHPWHFERNQLLAVKDLGFPFSDTTQNTLEHCLWYAMDQSRRVDQFFASFGQLFPQTQKVVS